MSNDALARITTLLGPGAYIDRSEDMLPYVTSMRNRGTNGSRLIAFPSATDSVAAIVKICRDEKLPMVPQGGNTGLVDGGIPSPRGNEIIINLSRMNKIREIDVIGSMVTAEAGVVLQTLQSAAASKGFLFPLSMASEGTMEVGGAISTNAGGTAVLRYGNTRQLVLGLEVVLPDGSVISGLKRLLKDNTGYNLSQYFIGAEGTLGIVTAATLRLFPAHQQKVTAVLAFADIQSVIDFFLTCRSEVAELLTTFEIMSQAALALVTRHMSGTRFPGRADAPWYVLIEFCSSSKDLPLMPLLEGLLVPALETGHILDAVIAKSSTEAQQFWFLREHIPESLRGEAGRIHFDISLPLSEIANFVRTMEAKLQKIAPDIVVLPFGHLGDGNLHYNMYAPSPRSADVFALLKKDVQNLVFGAVIERKGSISAEHGIGLERKELLSQTKSTSELSLMRLIKRGLDPLNLMNPGKIFDL